MRIEAPLADKAHDTDFVRTTWHAT
jgi:hypothetical protein